MKQIKTLIGDSCALIAGALLTLAFAPFHFYIFGIVSPALLLLLWLNSSPKRAFWRGWLFGAGLFGTGVYWIFISVHTFGNTSLFLALLITGAMIGILALFPAFNGYYLNRFFPKNNASKLLCAFPAIWLLFEWLRTWMFSGFPWLLVGYSQINTPLRGFAPIFSVYGTSLAVLISSGLLVCIFLQFRKNQNKTALIYLFSLLLLWLVGFGLSLIHWTKPSGQPVKVSLVQGNIPQEIKWSPQQVQPTLDHYMDLTNPHWDSHIIIWPEAAIPLPLAYATNFLEALATQAGQHKVALITGIPMKAEDRSGYYNTVITLGNGEGMYKKHRLVPFGEYIPFRDLLGGFLDLLKVPMSDFISGEDTPEPIIAHGKKIAVFICYEIAFPEQVLLRDGNIDMILTVSNDAWFGRSIAQAQHIEMAQMRALEMGRPVLFVANDGITAIINENGKIQSAAPAHVSFVLTDTVQTTEGKTPWQRFAIDPILSIALLMLAIAIWQRRRL
jgi:apolipoprotein N-acyltransferase